MSRARGCAQSGRYAAFRRRRLLYCERICRQGHRAVGDGEKRRRHGFDVSAASGLCPRQSWTYVGSPRSHAVIVGSGVAGVGCAKALEDDGAAAGTKGLIAWAEEL